MSFVKIYKICVKLKAVSKIKGLDNATILNGCHLLVTHNGSRLCEAVDFGKQKFNNIQKFNR
jgi:hypothetical protein